MQVNLDYYEDLTDEKIDEIIAALRRSDNGVGGS
jgi:hypothetical protein